MLKKLLVASLLLITGSLYASLDILQASRLITEPNLPLESVATSDDITSLYFNPAGLGVHPLQLGYFYGHNDEDNIQDHTIFLNLLGIAFSSQWRFAPKTLSSRKYTFGTSLQYSKLIGIGISYSWFESNSKLDGFKQADLGVLLRPFSFVSLGLVARALNKPRLAEEEFKPRYDLGLALRPLNFFLKTTKYKDSLTMSVDTTWGLKDTFVDLLPRYRLEFTPLQGIGLYGGWDNYTNVFFGINISQNIYQLSFQGNVPSERGSFYSAGALFSQERFKTYKETLSNFLTLDLEITFDEVKREGSLFTRDKITFYEIIRAIHMAKEDSKISAIVIKGRSFQGGWGQAEELRRALGEFSQEKPVYAFLESASNKEYYIASVAQRISMPEAGTLQINGLKSELFFLKDLFSKIGVEADFVHIGKYKSAPETFTNSEPSPYSEEQVKSILSSISKEYSRVVTKSRNISRQNLNNIMNKGFFNARGAFQNKLIDKVEYFDDMKDDLLKGNINKIFWSTELRSYIKTKFYDDSWGPKPAIALLVLEGSIISGKSTSSGIFTGASIGSDTISKYMKEIRSNPLIEAVVIRINSPGGSALASDVMWKEIRLLKEENIHVIVSVGNVAASGGYYLAVGADEIIANNTSITGSIGVFAGKFSLKGLYQLLGINKKIYTTHSKGVLFSETDKFSEAERKLLQEHLSEFYDLFLTRVQRSRTKLSREEIHANAQGRVYTGDYAKRKKMVDAIGGLNLALHMAAEKKGIDLENTDILVYPNEENNLFSIGSPTKLALPYAVKQSLKLLSKSEKFRNDQVFFMMPYELEVK